VGEKGGLPLQCESSHLYGAHPVSCYRSLSTHLRAGGDAVLDEDIEAKRRVPECENVCSEMTTTQGSR